MKLSKIYESVERSKIDERYIIEGYVKRLYSIQTLNESQQENSIQFITNDIMVDVLMYETETEALLFVSRLEEGFLDSVKGMAKGAWEGAKNIAKKVIGSVKKLITNVWSTIKGPISTFLDLTEKRYDKYVSDGHIYESIPFERSILETTSDTTSDTSSTDSLKGNARINMVKKITKRIRTHKNNEKLYDKLGTNESAVWEGYDKILKSSEVDGKFVPSLLALRKKPRSMDNAAYIALFSFFPMLIEEFHASNYVKADNDYNKLLSDIKIYSMKLKKAISNTDLLIHGFDDGFSDQLQNTNNYVEIFDNSVKPSSPDDLQSVFKGIKKNIAVKYMRDMESKGFNVDKTKEFINLLATEKMTLKDIEKILKDTSYFNGNNIEMKLKNIRVLMDNGFSNKQILEFIKAIIANNTTDKFKFQRELTSDEMDKIKSAVDNSHDIKELGEVIQNTIDSQIPANVGWASYYESKMKEKDPTFNKVFGKIDRDTSAKYLNIIERALNGDEESVVELISTIANKGVAIEYIVKISKDTGYLSEKNLENKLRLIANTIVNAKIKDIDKVVDIFKKIYDSNMVDNFTLNSPKQYKEFVNIVPHLTAMSVEKLRKVLLRIKNIK